MSHVSVAFDHVHLISEDPHTAASWYERLLGGRIGASHEVLGAPQIHVGFGDARIIVRGRRSGEDPVPRSGREWGVDHFGLQVDGDFDAFCARLAEQGVVFTLEPTQFNETTRIAFVEGPDGVSIELLQRSG